MGRPSKFTADRRSEILRARELGASLGTAAACGGVDKATLLRWLKRGENAEEGTDWRDFHEAMRGAAAKPNVRALEIVNRAMEERPELAWKFLERRERGYEPPQTGIAAVAPAGPLVVNVSFASGLPAPTPVLNEAEVIELEPVETEATDEAEPED